MQSAPAAPPAETRGKLERIDYRIGLPDLGSFYSLLSEVRREKHVLTDAERDEEKPGKKA
jgi:hypothetical protein